MSYGLNWEPPFNHEKTLNERATQMVHSEEYLNKILMIKSNNPHIKSMEFKMDGIII